MTPEEKSLLERTYKLTEENNSMIRSMRRATWISGGLRLIYWLVILGLSFGAYYFIQPYLTQVMGLYGEAQQSLDTFKSLSK